MTDNKEHAVSESVQEFYDKVGWKGQGSQTEDEARWEDSRAAAATYVSKCRLRVLRYIPEHGDKFLDAASGPIQYPEYVEYSRGYQRRYCVDLSAVALEKVEARFGGHVSCIQGNIVDLEIEDNFFDCTVSIHTIYHIAAEQQEAAVRNLLRMTCSGKPVIVVYGNPNSLMASFSRLLKPFRKPQEKDLYFHRHPLEWWSRFEDKATVLIEPWRFLAAEDSKKLIPDNAFGEWLLGRLFQWEEKHPRAAARLGRYPTIILTKRK